ncbi:AtuA-related protein [Actinophytocola sp.]|uniref:AtuA-related protein n=1 Tax=Actinophytocola sp. TaxID=1872138 RepID=UPI002ED44DA2
MLLHEIAHCRAGDKGNTATLSIFPRDDADYPILVRELTAARVREHLSAHVAGEVVRYELPGLCALQFVCHEIIDGGVTTSLALDTHGKSLSSRLLALDVEK